jgi:ABC-type protease/lipase transport system fused ATPase/permease subunit
MQFLFSSESKANLRAVILMAAGINELNLNTHLYLLQLFKYWSFEVVGG